VDFPVPHLDNIAVACRPEMPLPAGDERYCRLDSLRQQGGLAQLKAQMRTVPAETNFLHRCICGHRGSGKSTELIAFEQWARDNHYFPIRVDVDERLGLIALEAADLFLLAAIVVDEKVRPEGCPELHAARKDVAQWFAERVVEDSNTRESTLALEASAQLKAKLLDLAELGSKFTAGIKGNSSHAEKVRERLRNFPDALIDRAGALLDQANACLAQQGFGRGALLIFDNLDKFPPQHIDQALYKSHGLMQQLRCNVVYVIPISLEYQPLSGPIQDCYGQNVVLPMLNLRPTGSGWRATVQESNYDPEAIAQMRQVLEKRIVVSELLERPDDADWLVRLSGGCLRDLLHFVSEAVWQVEEDDSKLTHRALRRAVQTYRASCQRRLDEADFDALAAIAEKQAEQVPVERRRRLLYERFALEYLDENLQPWVDIHPLILEMEPFRDARQRYRRSR
jgi:hypothetical protein